MEHMCAYEDYVIRLDSFPYPAVKITWTLFRRPSSDVSKDIILVYLSVTWNPHKPYASFATTTTRPFLLNVKSMSDVRSISKPCSFALLGGKSEWAALVTWISSSGKRFSSYPSMNSLCNTVLVQTTSPQVLVNLLQMDGWTLPFSNTVVNNKVNTFAVNVIICTCDKSPPSSWSR